MTRSRRQKPHAFDCVAPDGGRHIIRSEGDQLPVGWKSYVPLYRHPAPAAETFLVTILRKGDGMPEFQFMAQPDFATANFIAGSVVDAMCDASGNHYDYSIKPGQIGSAVDGFVEVLRAAREAATS